MQDESTPHGKIELNIGSITFSGEGDQDWLSAQIDKLIVAATTKEIADAGVNGVASTDSQLNEPVDVGPLATYLKSKGGETIQNQRFLATAAWLHHRGEQCLVTNLITKALREHQQKRLGNTSECLNQNISKGFCEKKPDKSFFITSEGWKQLREDR